jgi:transcriptional regulator with XRE-family HTH domain
MLSRSAQGMACDTASLVGSVMIALLRKTRLAAASGPGVTDLAGNLRRLRKERALTLDELSLKCGVSRAMLSKIERGVSTPTATVLGKIAAGFGIGLSRLVGGQVQRSSLMLTPGEQPLFRDPESGLERRSLSPLFSDRSVDFALNVLPTGRSVSFPAHQDGVEEYLYVVRGALRVVVDDTEFNVLTGSMLFYSANAVHEFHNDGDDEAEFFIVVDSGAGR